MTQRTDAADTGRRDFLITGAGVVAATALPFAAVVSGVLGSDAAHAAPLASERKTMSTTHSRNRRLLSDSSDTGGECAELGLNFLERGFALVLDEQFDERRPRAHLSFSHLAPPLPSPRGCSAAPASTPAA